MTTKPGKNVVPSDDDPQILVGRILNGQYRIDDVLDVGGMGFVFGASKVGTNRKFAVKMLKPSMAKDIDIAKRFQREIDVMGMLDHPHIVSIVDSGRDASGFVYLVMEFLQGDTFSKMLADSALSLDEIVEVFRQVCDALIEAHGLDVIHRDLKLENIMVRRMRDHRLHATVLDFGVARPLGMRMTEALTRTGEVPGTPSIVAPELVDNYTPTPQSDLYSLGCVMFSAIAGQPPFTGKNEFDLVHAHKTQEVPNLATIVPDVPEPLLELVYALMQKEPTLRPDSASEVRDRIESLQKIHFSKRSGVYVPPDAVLETVDIERPNVRTEENPDERMIAPTSIVSLLIAMVMVLALILIYLAYHFLIVVPNAG